MYSFYLRRMLLFPLLLGAPILCAQLQLWYDEKGLPWQYVVNQDGTSVEIERTPQLRAYNGTIEIPKNIAGYPVKNLGSATFGGCAGITHIIVPPSVSLARMYPFLGCGAKTITFQGDKLLAEPYLFAWCASLETVKFPKQLQFWSGDIAFQGCESLKVCIFPKATEGLGLGYTFWGCSSLEYVWLPPALSNPWNETTFNECGKLQQVVFTGEAPEGGDVSLIPNGARITYPKADAAAWGNLIPEERRGTFTELIDGVEVEVSSKMVGTRTMEVTYHVTSEEPEVTVRAIAVRDGEKSFSNVVPIRTLSVGQLGKVAANTTHHFVWDIAKDWEADLETVTPLILVKNESLLPIDEVTLPGEGDLAPFTVNRVPLYKTQVFDALLWCYAEGDPRLTVSQGVASVDGVPIAEGAEIVNLPKALEYLYAKMGYREMTEAEVAHWERVMRVSYASYGLENLQVRKREGE